MRRRLLVPLIVATLPVSVARGQTSYPPGPGNETKLEASDGEPTDSFGYAVSLSVGTALIGTPRDDADENTRDSGSAYVFAKRDGTWVEEAKLVPADSQAAALFGSSVSLVGDVALIGAPGDNENGWYSGAAYVFERRDGQWVEAVKLLAADGEAWDGFGSSVSLSQDGALVGVPGDDDHGSAAGAAIVFERASGHWEERAKLLASDGSGGDGLGLSVSLSGDLALVGAPEDADYGPHTGAAYVFERSGERWTEQAKLLASDPEDYDHFGISLSHAGQTALVGAREGGSYTSGGSAYVFLWQSGVWLNQAKLEASDRFIADFFGDSVSLSGETALIGASGDDGAGSAYVFTRHDSRWIERVKLIASDRQLGDQFGYSVSLSRGTALIGAYGADGVTGSAYIYEPDPLGLAVDGTCPGTAVVTVSNAPPNSEVAVVTAAGTFRTKLAGSICNGAVLEIEEPFALPPRRVGIGESGRGSAVTTLQAGRCWVEALSLASCETSPAVLVP